MTEYIPGRIYSGVVDGERVLLTRKKVSFKCPWRSASGGDLLKDDEVADVRGPLVVLDLSDVDVEYAVKMMRECGCDVNVIADQIEEQTRPPLQVGVHLAWSRSEGRRAYMCWDGNFWWYSDSNKSLADWESIHYVGPGGSDD